MKTTIVAMVDVYAYIVLYLSLQDEVAGTLRDAGVGPGRYTKRS